MIKREEVYKIGMFNKPHGIHGELSFTFTDDIFDRAEEVDYIICLLDGILVPFFIEEYRFRTETTALMKLEGVDTAERARMFTNIEVYFPSKYAEEDESGECTWNYFQGFTVHTYGGEEIGKITAIDDSTLNVLFCIDRQGEELFIPAQEDFIVYVDHNLRIMVLNLPEGLLDL